MASSLESGGLPDSPAEFTRCFAEGNASLDRRLALLEAEFDRCLHPAPPPGLRQEGLTLTHRRLLAAALGLAVLASLAFACGYALAAG